ncbi:methyl-accepting chemotaxis protein [Amphritea sp. HPY]|uniref:methyl-accepting chemotaxis protein n=1 Tax=Amphritea sp. HPY TaxID=3421652 RepID=UPI003D7D6708
MRLNVTHKFIIGFALMVIFIVVVGAGGLFASRTISNHFFKVSDNVIPSLSGSFQQMIYLEQANAELFAAISQNRVKDLNRKRQLFKARILQFNEEQALVAEKVTGNPELTVALQRIQSVSERFFSITEKVMADRKQSLILKFRTQQAEIEFLSLGDSLHAWMQRLSESNPGPEVLERAKELSLMFSMHRFQLVNFQRTRDLDELNTTLADSDGELLRAYQALAQVAPGEAVLKRVVDSIQKHIYGDGLVSYYATQVAADLQLAERLKQTDQLIVQARQEMDAFIAANNQLAVNARHQAEQQESFSHTWILGLSVGAVFFAVVVGGVMVRAIRRPLSQIHQGLAQVRQGDLRIKFEEQRNDEFGDLSRYLNSVVEGLKDTLQQVSDGSARLSDVAERNASISQQTTQSMNMQSMQLEQTSSAAVQMEHSVAEVAQHSQTTLNAVDEFEQLSNDVSRQMLGTIASIETQASGIDQAMSVSNEMASFGDKIATILATIQGIADKTNLLALNAAIEAARAGEQGRGFAVVADEVRGLAGRTRDSVQDIKQMVESMQDAIHRVSEVMNQSYQQSQDCVEKASESQQVLQAMNDAVSHIRDMNAHIENAAGEQTGAVAEVSRTLVSINSAAAETFQGAEQAAHSSHELLDVAHQQQALLRRFSID